MKIKHFSFLKPTLIFIVSISILIFMVGCSGNQPEQSTASVSPASESVSSTSAADSEVNDDSNDGSVPTSAEEVTLLKSASITDGAHDVSAVIELYSDNTLLVTGFNYDGKAPDVYIAIGTKPDGGEFEPTQMVSEKLEGAYENGELTINLPEGATFDAVSVYCEQYNDDFGSVVLS